MLAHAKLLLPEHPFRLVGVNVEMRKSLLRLAIMFAWIPIAFAIGSAAHSVNAFVVVMAIGLVAGVALRLTLLR